MTEKAVTTKVPTKIDTDISLPPGIYLARIEVDVDSGSATATSVHRLVQVAY